MSDTTVTTTPPQANTPEARTPSGEIKPTPAAPATTPPETTKPSTEASAKGPEGASGDARTEETSLLNTKEPLGAGPPEKYEWKLPEGMTMDEETTKEVDGLFRGIGLDNESGQKLIDFYQSKLTEAMDAPFQLWADTQKEWVDQIKSDPELGRRLPEVKATVSRAIDGLGDPKLAAEFRRAMDITGAGNNPAFVKAFYKLAQQVTEGRPVGGRGPSAHGQEAPDARPKTAAQALFPGLPSSSS